MVKAVILKTDGTFEKVNLYALEDYSRQLHNDHVSLLPTSRKYYAEKQKHQSPIAYVADNGIFLQLQLNPWLNFLSFTILHPSVTQIYGNIILISEDKNGEEVNLDSYFITLIERYDQVKNNNSKSLIFMKEIVKQ